MLLTFDPSTRCTGYAVFDPTRGADAKGLIEAGRITPSLSKDVTRALRPAVAAHFRGARRGLRATLSIVQQVEVLLDRLSPLTVVVEVPSGQAGSAMKKGASPGALGVMGLAQGAVWATCLARIPGSAVGVDERAWTTAYGVTAKDKRQADLAYKLGGQYDAERDPGGDVSDAIALGLWWLRCGAAV